MELQFDHLTYAVLALFILSLKTYMNENDNQFYASGFKLTRT